MTSPERKKEMLAIRSRRSYLKNRDAVLQRGRDRYDRNRDAMLRYSRAYRAANRDKCVSATALWHSKNKDRHNAVSREWNARNRDRCNSNVSRWAKNNPAKICAKRAVRRARVIKAMPSWVDRDAMGEIYTAAAHISDMSGRPHHVDHIYPLVHAKFSGLHVPWNLQVLTASENMSKGNRLCL